MAPGCTEKMEKKKTHGPATRGFVSQHDAVSRSEFELDGHRLQDLEAQVGVVDVVAILPWRKVLGGYRELERNRLPGWEDFRRENHPSAGKVTLSVTARRGWKDWNGRLVAQPFNPVLAIAPVV